MYKWYCARTKVSFPWDTTIDQLKRQEFPAWMPIVRHTTFQMGKKIIVETPLFGAYLFVQFDISTQRWRLINNTVGITRLLPERNEFPQPIAQGFVEALQSRPSVAAVEDLTVKYAADAVVKIIAGSFQGRFAKVLTSHRAATRVRFEAFAGRELVATLPTRDLALAGEA
jgi:transcriptional antiterminator RfaH